VATSALAGVTRHSRRRRWWPSGGVAGDGSRKPWSVSTWATVPAAPFLPLPLATNTFTVRPRPPPRWCRCWGRRCPACCPRARLVGRVPGGDEPLVVPEALGQQHPADEQRRGDQHGADDGGSSFIDGFGGRSSRMIRRGGLGHRPGFSVA
jgi:hypothetical protein